MQRKRCYGDILVLRDHSCDGDQRIPVGAAPEAVDADCLYSVDVWRFACNHVFADSEHDVELRGAK